ncbi:MAG: D-alanyl-D-alanine carboxypeptidase family protein [Bacillota bacterium]|nr:D-alanyl-D-alanine carboxypeptidase family protein [Bacillota bacterium]
MTFEHLSFTQEDTGKGSLILVNCFHPLQKHPEGSQLLNINSLQVEILSPHKGIFENPLTCLEHPINEIYLQKQAATMLLSLIKRSGAGGKITAVSGYRSKAEQTAIWTETLEREGEAFTETYVAHPGCSEHETGLAIDLAGTAPSIDYIRPCLPRQGSLASFCSLAAQFGFIIRYPEGKEEITHIGHEPWHFRYVGFPHSVIMTQQGLVLEEYVEMLENETSPLKPLLFTQSGAHIDIMHISMNNHKKVELDFSDALPYTLSGTNCGGVILTRFRR